jgi:hypothetical protein
LPKEPIPNEDNGQLIIVPIAPADVVAITSRRVNFLVFMVIYFFYKSLFNEQISKSKKK